MQKEFEIKNNVLVKYDGNEKEVIIPDGVEGIENWAFSDCIDLISISIPNSVKNIGSYAFSNCKNLIKINIPDGIEEICNGIFWECTSLENVILPNSIKIIYGGAFYGCSNLKEIKIPSGVTYISNGAFDNCKKLVSIELPKNIEYIGHFKNLECIKNITIPSYKVFSLLWYDLKEVAIRNVVENFKIYSENDKIEFKEWLKEEAIQDPNLMYILLYKLDKMFITLEEINNMLINQKKHTAEINAMLLEYTNKNFDISESSPLDELTLDDDEEEKENPKTLKL